MLGGHFVRLANRQCKLANPRYAQETHTWDNAERLVALTGLIWRQPGVSTTNQGPKRSDATDIHSAGVVAHDHIPADHIVVGVIVADGCLAHVEGACVAHNR